MPPDAPAGREGQRELEAAVAEEVMGWTVKRLGDQWFAGPYMRGDSPGKGDVQLSGGAKAGWYEWWRPSAVLEDVALVEAEIARRGLQRYYVAYLAGLVGIFDALADRTAEPQDLFALVTASPAARCRAALAAVRGTE